MNKQTFIQILQNPSSISAQQAKELEKLVANFPYCQAAHILIAKYHSDSATMHTAAKIKKAAVYTLDRSNLKKLLYSSQNLEHPSHSLQQLTEIKNHESLPQQPITKQPASNNPNLQKENIEQKLSNEKNNKSTPSENKNISPTPPTLSGNTLLEELQQTLLQSKEMRSKREAFLKEENLKKENISPKVIEPTEKTSTNIVESEQEKEKITFAEQQDKNTEIKNTDTSEFIEPEALTNTQPIQTEQINIEHEKITTVNEPKQETPNDDIDNTKKAEQQNQEIYYSEKINQFVQSIQNEYSQHIAKDTANTEMQIMLEYLSYLDSKRNLFKKSKKKEDEIINKVIQGIPVMPKLNLNKLPEQTPDLAEKSSVITKNVASENYAKILALQGKRDKAIEIYNQLILKFPEKKTYFENQIEKLKK